MFESFGYKHGIPGDADFVFDVRSLPNPYWQPALRHLNGRDEPVAAYLATHDSVRVMIAALTDFLADAHRGVRPGQPQLSHHRHRLHRRPASVRVHRRGAGAAFPAVFIRRCSHGTTRCRKPDIASAPRKVRISSRPCARIVQAERDQLARVAALEQQIAEQRPRAPAWRSSRPWRAAARANSSAIRDGGGARFRKDPARASTPGNRCAGAWCPHCAPRCAPGPLAADP